MLVDVAKLVYFCYTKYTTILLYSAMLLYTYYRFNALKMSKTYFDGTQCPKEFVLALNDTLNVVTGKWKLAIVSALLFERKRFSDIQRMITKITPRMLSKELKELELNGILTRTVYDTTPVLVEYELTPSGKQLSVVIDTMVEWGMQHRESVISID